MTYAKLIVTLAPLLIFWTLLITKNSRFELTPLKKLIAIIGASCIAFASMSSFHDIPWHISLAVSYFMFIGASRIFGCADEQIDNLFKLPIMVVLLYKFVSDLNNFQKPESVSALEQLKVKLPDSPHINDYVKDGYETKAKFGDKGVILENNLNNDTAYPNLQIILTDENNEIKDLKEDSEVIIDKNPTLFEFACEKKVIVNIKNKDDKPKKFGLTCIVDKNMPNSVDVDFGSKKIKTPIYIDGYGALSGDKLIRNRNITSSSKWFGLTDYRQCYYIKGLGYIKEITELNGKIYLTFDQIEVNPGEKVAYNLNLLTSPKRMDLLQKYPEFERSYELFNYSILPLMSRVYRGIFRILERSKKYINPILCLIIAIFVIMMPLYILYSIFFRKTGKKLYKIIEIMLANKDAAQNGQEVAIKIASFVQKSRLSARSVALYIIFMVFYSIVLSFPLIQIKNSGIFFKSGFLWVKDLSLPFDPINLKNFLSILFNWNLDSNFILRMLFKINPSLSSLVFFAVQYVSLVLFGDQSKEGKKSTLIAILVLYVLMGSFLTPILVVSMAVYQCFSKFDAWILNPKGNK